MLNYKFLYEIKIYLQYLIQRSKIHIHTPLSPVFPIIASNVQFNLTPHGLTLTSCRIIFLCGGKVTPRVTRRI